ncbi:MAG: hypothetical protein HY076_06280 [Candidatus Eisenbacteria bacterium]|uniref:T9SS type A sorting domain-containing protein n=1 Tax=Eiseniibacteriota bacterium TaxID=2212470 RepID=A0A9D6L4V1_UNCEI|nr:hypothetical protein [Candidatus Eisenbacteria bacterium]MBI3539862.1 hypothetical protein [Candidatus Eisenbacteria bacterium]
MARLRVWCALGIALLLTASGATVALARPDAQMIEEFRTAYPELFTRHGGRTPQPMAVPDIFGPGAVLNVGNIYMKVTNFAIIGNPFTNVSSDPSGQWPGASGIEYLSFMAIGIGGVNSSETDPASIRRVSYQAEWRPQTLDPVDRMYKSYDGQINGLRLFDDDGDAAAHDPLDAQQWVDEDFLDGRDNDGDGKIDEDYAAYGQEMWSCVMWDNTQAALSATFNEKHVPLNLEMRQTAFAYSVPGFQDFNAITLQIFNRSGHGIDSMYVGIRWDMDAGPVDIPTFFSDDFDVPFFPHGDFPVVLSPDNKWGAKMDPKGYRRQLPHRDIPSVPADSALCPVVNVRVNGFSIADDDGDNGRTTGIPSVLLLGHTVDPLGYYAPTTVGWRGFRSFIAGTPYAAGGNPVVDQQRFDMFASQQNIDPNTGFIIASPVDQKGDIQGWAWIGPFGVTTMDIFEGRVMPHPIPDGGMIEVTIAFAVQTGDYATVSDFPADYDAYLAGAKTTNDLFDKYPALENAFAAQVAYEGVYDDPPSVFADDQHNNTPDDHGRETRLRAPRGFLLTAGDCRDEGTLRQINEFGYTWFDFDCNYCTGVYVSQGNKGGKFLKRWNTAAPPPNPTLNVSAGYNFTDNPARKVSPSRDNAVLLAWDNLSETSVDPEKGDFDFRSYRVWKVANWRRPVGSSGPADADWALLAHFRFFDYADSNKERFRIGQTDTLRFFPSVRDTLVRLAQPVCPEVFIPNLSIHSVVASKGAYASSAAAASAIQAMSGLLIGKQINYPLNASGTMTQDGTSYRFAQAEGECTPGTFRTVALDSAGTLVAEVCENPLAQNVGFRVPLCLYRGDLWDHQSGQIMRPQPNQCPVRGADATCLVDTIPCVKDAGGNCVQDHGYAVGTQNLVFRTRYPVGRYQFLDHEVKNGFVYFYAVTAGDSTASGSVASELTGRRSGVEAEAVVPQAATRTGKNVWVVPNPYRGYPEISRRSSSWDLTPNATDPTGTHIDFMGMPPGVWTVRIYTVSGDLVQTLKSTDAVNESVRGPATIPNPNYNPNIPTDPVSNPKTIIVPGYNRQQDNPSDGEARWNLISRNGQDVVSGIYLFVVNSSQGTQRGKFVIIR